MEIFGLGIGEIVLIVGVLLLLFGAAKLPELGKSIGQFGKEVKKGFGDEPAEKKKAKEE